MQSITLHNYTILLDGSLKSLTNYIEQKGYSSVYILVDENTKAFCLPIIKEIIQDYNLLQIRSGEENKNLDTCSNIWQQLATNNADRKALLINLGGGVIGDMGGFAASCYKRGIDFINIPTTVLSQVDSSIGGKLGIDFKYGKNIIGLFKNPQLVLISSIFFKTLSQRHFVNGWAEILKHALIKNRNQWEAFQSISIQNCNIDEIVYQSLLIKKEVVEADPYEKGIRKILNFGHTIGHAIESYALENSQFPLLHGEAIAIGMITEAYIATQKCGLSKLELEDITNRLLHFFPKVDISSFDFEKMYSIMQWDKKNDNNKIKMALVNTIGNCVYDIEVSKEEILQGINYYIQLD